MRCDQCKKFVPFDTDVEPEVSDEEASGGQAQFTVRITNNCADCGQELKEANFEFSEGYTPGEGCECESHNIDVEASRTERVATTDRHGKPIKKLRYQRVYYGVEGEARITCDCGATEDLVNFSDEIQASYMDELV